MQKKRSTLNSLLMIFSLLGSIAVLYRILFIVHWVEASHHAFFFSTIGIAYDLLIVSQISILLYILLYYWNKLSLVSFIFVQSMWIIFNYINYIYFLEFRNHLPYSTLMYFKTSEWQHLQGSFFAELFSWSFLFFALIPIVLSIMLIFRWQMLLPNRSTFFRGIGVLVFLALLAGSYANTNIKFHLHPLQNNPLFYFLVRTSTVQKEKGVMAIPKQEIQIWNEFQQRFFNQTPYKREKPLVQKKNYSTVPFTELFHQSGIQKLFQGKKPNIVLIMMEQVNADRIKPYNPASDLTPNFAKLATKGILFEHFYANGFQTMHGQLATLCGLYPNPGVAVFRHFFQNQLHCLPTQLAHQGYDTAWIHAGSGNFDNQAVFLAKNGFQRIISDLDFSPELEKLTWGYADHDLMKKAVSVMREQKPPFFSMILTTTNHHPHQLPQDYNPTQEDSVKGEATVRYTDYALGLFFDWVEQEDFFQNTLFLITSDTGSSLLSSNQPIADPLQMPNERIPLLLYWKEAPRVIVDPRIASQVDIASSLADLLELDKVNHFVGRSLFRNFPSQTFVKSNPTSVQIFEISLSQNTNDLHWHQQINPSKENLNQALQKIINYSYQNNQLH